jgi:hypothetical protein
MLWMNTTLRWFTAAAAHALFTLVLRCCFVPRTGIGVCSIALQETETVVGAVSCLVCTGSSCKYGSSQSWRPRRDARTAGLGSGPWCVYVWDGRSRESRMVNRRAGVQSSKCSVARALRAALAPKHVHRSSPTSHSLARAQLALAPTSILAAHSQNPTHATPIPLSPPTSPLRPAVDDLARARHLRHALCVVIARRRPSPARCTTRACFLATTLLRVLHPISCAHFAQLSHRAHP